jgi:hypothetical protein
MDETLPPLPSDAITSEEWQQTPASVRNWIGEVLTEVKQLHETVEQLQEIVNMHGIRLFYKGSSVSAIGPEFFEARKPLFQPQ